MGLFQMSFVATLAQVNLKVLDQFSFQHICHVLILQNLAQHSLQEQGNLYCHWFPWLSKREKLAANISSHGRLYLFALLPIFEKMVAVADASDQSYHQIRSDQDKHCLAGVRNEIHPINLSTRFIYNTKIHISNMIRALGGRQKLLKGFFPLRDGGYPPIPLSFFGKDDFPLR